MNDAIDFVVKVMGAGIAIVPLFATVWVVNSAAQGMGKLGGFLTDSRRGAGLKKKAGEYVDYRKNLRQANALGGVRTFGGFRFRRQQNRELRNQAAEAGLKSAQAQFGVTNTKAAGYTQSIAQSNAQVSALNAAANTRMVTGIATGATQVGAGMNPAVVDKSQNPEVVNALNAQQERAIAEAIKDAQITANIQPGDVQEMGRQLATAVQSGDSIKARAMQNMLLTSGSPGISEYRDTMTKLGDNDPRSMDGPAVTAMRKNLLDNHGAIKASAADLTRQAAKGGTMRDAFQNSGTWNMSDNELVRQKPASIELAVRSGAISSARAGEIMQNSELFDNLTKESKALLNELQNSPGVNPRNLTSYVHTNHL